MRRIDRIVVQVVVSTWEGDKLLNEEVTQPLTLFRGTHPDPWTYLDSQLKESDNERNSH